MVFKKGNTYTSLEYDLGEVREIEIINIYREDKSYKKNDNTGNNIITYRYYGIKLPVWYYRVHRDFELVTKINKAEQIKKNKT